MPSYLNDLVKKAKRIKTEENTVKTEKEKIKIDEEQIRKTMVLEKRKRQKQLQEELRKQIPAKEEKEIPTKKEKKGLLQKFKKTEEKEEKKEEERIVSEVEKELELMEKEEIDSYGEVKIYRVPEKILPYYVVPVTKPTLGERTIINTIKEAATRLISIAPYKIRDPEQRRTVYRQKIIEILQASNELSIPERRYSFYAEAVVREMVGYGLIDSLIRDDRLEEIMVIGPKKPVYVFHRKHEMMVTNIEFFSDSEIVDLINRIAREIGRRVDMSAPLLDARLPDGSRVNATIPPASISGSSLTIRKFREDPYSIIDLIKYGTFDTESAAFLWLCVDGLGVKPANILITGGTGSGKTTTLNVFASFIPERERIVTIEDSVDGEEEIIVFKDDKPQKVKIGELIDKKIQENGCNYLYSGHESILNFEDIETFCFDEKGKIKKIPIYSFIRHKTNKKMYEIVFRSGRKIKVTKDHSLFSLNEKAEINPVKTSELKEGSFLAVPRKLPFECKGLNEIDLFKHLKKLKNCFLTGKPIAEELKKIETKTLEEYSAGKTKKGRECSANTWKRTGVIKAELLHELKIKGLIELKDRQHIFLKPKVNPKKIPLNIKLDEIFLQFIGFWIADGCYDKNSIILSTDDKEVELIIREVAERFNANVKMHSDKFSFMINSKMLKTVMQEVLDLKGNAFTKKMPEWITELNNQQICWILKGYLSGDGTIAKHEIEWTSCSKQLMKDIQTMLLRNGIMARTATKRYLKDKSFKGRISSHSQIKLFIEKIGFLQEGKNNRASKTILKGKATHDLTDLIPLPVSFVQSKKQELRLQHEYYSGHSNIGRRFLQKMVSSTESNELEILAGSDIFWDQIKEIKVLPEKERFVYDLSIPGYENFVCSNVFVHNTAELNLPLKHIIRLESRPPGLEGTGEITLDILTKNSLRMRPDRIIVGEVRHDEAFSLFTAMNTGHDGAVTGDSLIQLSDGNIIEISELANKFFEEKHSIKENDYEFIELGKNAVNVPSWNKKTLKIEDKKITHLWRKKTKETLKKIKLRSGKELHLTKDHPIYKIDNGIKEINAEEAIEGDSIIVEPKTNCSHISNLVQGQTTMQIQILAESDLRFEEIVSVEEEEFEGTLYDLTVEDNHNYIANGVIVSNCLGTIHANSPQETLVRVTSPPMNVPEVMLSGLDLIVVEHRIHDKKKGTIRRITEIAEVTGVLENKTSTQTLFERDSLKDKLIKTNVQSEYMKTLMKFTGYTSKQIEQELKDREEFFEELVKNGVHEMDQVVEKMHEYMQKK